MKAAKALLFLLAWLIAAPALAQQTITVGNGTEPESLDPHKATDIPSAEIIFQLFEGLVTYGPDASVVPGVAKDWERSADGLRYVFHLRPEARWSDGKPVTAEDFVYSFRRAVDPRTGSSYQFILYPILNAQQITEGEEKDVSKLGVAARGPATLEITLKAPTPYFIGLLAHQMAMPVPKAAIEAWGPQWIMPGHLVGNGAYLLSDWTPQSRVRVTRNPRYWDAASVTLDAADFLPIENEAAGYNAYRAGEIDVTSVPQNQLKAVKQAYPDEIAIGPLLATAYFAFNTRQPPLDNRTLRQALTRAIDREIITGKITAGDEIPAYSFTPSSTADYRPPQPAWADLPPAERLAQARALFAQAGYGASHKLSLEILYNTSQSNKRIAVVVAAMWKQAFGDGLAVSLRNEEFKVKLADARTKQFQIVSEGWVGDYNDVNTFADLLLSGNELNDASYSNPEYDRLVHAGQVELDPAKRARLYAEAEALMLAEAPIMPLYFQVSHSLIKPGIRGWQPNVAGLHLLKYVHVTR